MILRAWLSGLAITLLVGITPSLATAAPADAIDPALDRGPAGLRLADIAPDPDVGGAPEPQAADVQPAPDDGDTPPPAAASLDGRWLLGEGLVVEFAGGRYEAFDRERKTAGGTYSVDGERFTFVDDDGDSITGRLTFGEGVVLIEPEDESPILLHAGDAPLPPGDPADLVGRWRTSEGDVVELDADGRIAFDNGDTGSYRVEGDLLIVEGVPSPGGERMRWTKLGERVVFTFDDDDEVVILTPEGREAAASVPEATTPDATATEEPQAADEAPAAAGPSPVDGRWTMAPGMVIAFANGRYEVFRNGALEAQGGFTVEGDMLVLRRDDDEPDFERRSRFTQQGDAILIEPEGDNPAVLFAETPSGAAAAPNPQEFEGRWRSDDGDLFEIGGGRYAFYRSDGLVSEQGSYTVTGDTLTIHSDEGDQVDARWARFGARVALRLDTEDGKVLVLTPEAADAEQLPQRPTEQETQAPGTTAQTPGTLPAETPVEAPVTPPQAPVAPAQVEQPAPSQPAPSVAQPQPVPPVTTQPPPLPPLAVRLSDGTPLGERWAGYLKGRRLAQGIGQPVVQLLDLCSDGQYFWLVGQGTAMPMVQGSGYWSVVTQGQVASLQLTPAGAAPGFLQLDFDGQTAYLNRIPTQVLQMNQSCE